MKEILANIHLQNGKPPDLRQWEALRVLAPPDAYASACGRVGIAAQSAAPIERDAA